MLGRAQDVRNGIGYNDKVIVWLVSVVIPSLRAMTHYTGLNIMSTLVSDLGF